jgi:hypothetical protein
MTKALVTVNNQDLDEDHLNKIMIEADENSDDVITFYEFL